MMRLGPMRTTARALTAAGLLFGATATVTTVIAADDEYARFRDVLKPIPALPPIPADNSLTPERVQLGKMLYWDRRTSKTGQTSCAFCHHPAYYGAEPMERSVGVYGEVHAANAHTVLNAAFLEPQFFSGSAKDLEQQALGAVRSHVASRSWPAEVAERLNRLPEYKELSKAAYGDELTEEIIGKAIASFMRTLITPNYPLARWLGGDDDALTVEQKRGMAAFVERGCVACHTSPYFTNSTFQKFEIEGGEHHLGRYKVTKREEDKWLYKVPTLLNVAKTPPYTHAGVVHELPEMVRLMGTKMLGV